MTYSIYRLGGQYWQMGSAFSWLSVAREVILGLQWNNSSSQCRTWIWDLNSSSPATKILGQTVTAERIPFLDLNAYYMTQLSVWQFNSVDKREHYFILKNWVYNVNAQGSRETNFAFIEISDSHSYSRLTRVCWTSGQIRDSYPKKRKDVIVLGFEVFSCNL